jgi:hypothetical protein
MSIFALVLYYLGKDDKGTILKLKIMKKFILLTMVASFFATSLFAQDSKVEEVFKKYRFGLYLGPTFNSLKPVVDVAEDNNGNYDVSKGDGRTSFSAGLNMELNLNEKYTIYSGVGLDWNGGSIVATYDSMGSTSPALNDNYVRHASIAYKNQYLSIPLGLKMYAAEFGDIKIFAQTGIDLSLLLSQKGDYYLVKKDYSELEGSNKKLGPYASVFPINAGWHIGVGGEYGLANGSAAYASVLYRNGFTDYTTPKSNDKGNRFADGNIRSNTFAIRIGYFF